MEGSGRDVAGAIALGPAAFFLVVPAEAAHYQRALLAKAALEVAPLGFGEWHAPVGCRFHAVSPGAALRGKLLAMPIARRDAWIVTILVLAGCTTPGAEAATRDTAAAELPDVVIHPVVGPHFLCLEHPLGQLRALGDALGSDCLVPELGAGPVAKWPAFYRREGRRNEDWYGWGIPVLAPFDGVVDSVHVNPTANRPGQQGRGRATIIVFQRADGVRVLYAHVQAVRVQPGDRVRAGQRVARVGNNGPAWFPHTHVGAWRGTTPLQVRFDLRAMGTMSRSR